MSIIIHICFLVWVLPKIPKALQSLDSELQSLEVQLIDPVEPQAPKQMVEFERKTQQKPEKSRFLAKNDHKAEKEVINKTPSDKNRPRSGAVSLRVPRKKPATPKVGKGHKGNLAMLFPEEAFQEHKQRRLERNRNDQHKGSMISGGMIDSIEKIEAGDKTLLDTAAFKFYGYFNRMRHKVRQYWVANVQGAAYKTFMVGQPLAADMGHRTTVILVLNKSGLIKDVKVVQSSGNRFLDKATIEAFLQSGGFPNPPKGLFEDDKQQIEITWSFLVKVT